MASSYESNVFIANMRNWCTGHGLLLTQLSRFANEVSNQLRKGTYIPYQCVIENLTATT